MKRLLDPLFQSKMDYLLWRYRHILHSDWKIGYLDAETIEHEHRKLIAQACAKFGVVENVLEIGCGAGGNILRMAKKLKETRFHGIDINRRAIEQARSFAEKNGLYNISFSWESYNALTSAPDKTYDLIISDAVLMYSHPSDLRHIISEMLRVSKKGIVICEQVTEQPIYIDNWIHNYLGIINSMPDVTKINRQKIKGTLWSENWEKYGEIITVFKKQVYE